MYDLSGLFCRICKFRKEEEKETFTDNKIETDRTAFLMGEDGLKEMFFAKKKSLISMLVCIGFTQVYIKEKIERGFVFQFLLFDKFHIRDIFPANWEGVVKLRQKLKFIISFIFLFLIFFTHFFFYFTHFFLIFFLFTFFFLVLLFFQN